MLLLQGIIIILGSPFPFTCLIAICMQQVTKVLKHYLHCAIVFVIYWNVWYNTDTQWLWASHWNSPKLVEIQSHTGKRQSGEEKKLGSAQNVDATLNLIFNMASWCLIKNWLVIVVLKMMGKKTHHNRWEWKIDDLHHFFRKKGTYCTISKLGARTGKTWQGEN